MNVSLQGQKVWQRPARRRPRFYESESSGEEEEAESEDSDDEVRASLPFSMPNSP